MDIAVDPSDDATAYIVFSGFGSGHVFKTTDYGNKWTNISGDLPDLPTNAVVVDPIYPDHIYVGNDFGVYVSTNGGASWESFQTGLHPATMIFDLVISPIDRKLRAATHGSGAYQRDLLENPLDAENLDEVVKAFSIYPNPAGAQTTVSFSLTEAQEVRLRLLDASGSLLEERPAVKYAAGTHRIDWSCADLPAGIYFVQLRSEAATQTQQLVVN
ncbi:MAG: T9SS type A sorting domain-containing protein, partial [Bacteroidota bacterium]